jgi:hypothetical protein
MIFCLVVQKRILIVIAVVSIASAISVGLVFGVVLQPSASTLSPTTTGVTTSGRSGTLIGSSLPVFVPALPAASFPCLQQSFYPIAQRVNRGHTRYALGINQNYPVQIDGATSNWCSAGGVISGSWNAKNYCWAFW